MKTEDLTVLEQTTQLTHKRLYLWLPSQSHWKKLSWGLNLLNGRRLYYKTITCQKKILPFVQSYKITPPLHHLKNNFTNKWHQSSLHREKYTKTQRFSPRLSSGAKIVGHLSHSTELVRMCLACQHFDFNSADWISDNLHVISSRYLRTMGKEFIFQFSRRSWGRNAWRTPKNVCVGG